MAVPSFAQKHSYAFQEYLQLEQQDDARYEYFDGEVTAMAGSSLNHSDIAFNITRQLNATFRKRGCRCFQEGVKAELQKTVPMFILM